ncbi:hypothetical protein WJX77_006182 [Trebouxia sp. C0004]
MALQARSDQLRQSLDWSHQVSQEACRVLDQYCSQLSDLERVVQPVVFKTQALIRTRENIKQARAQAEEVLDHLDASRKVESRILQGPRSDLSSFMTAFEKLDLAITFLQKHRNLSTAEDALRHATDLQKDGLRLCQEEFMTVLKGNLQEPNAARLVQGSFPSQDIAVSGGRQNAAEAGPQPDLALVSPAVLPRLHTLAQAMLRCRGSHVFKAYCDLQREVLDRALGSLPNQATSSEDLSKMSWSQVEKKVNGWVQALQVLTQIAVAQSQLSRAVFDSPYAEAAFDEIVSKHVVDLTKLGQAILHSKRAPEKVFGLLDMHEQLDGHLSVLSEVLSNTNSGILLRDLRGLHERLQVEIQETFTDFLGSISKDPAKNTVPDGTVHPLTATTLSFLKRLFTYKSALHILFQGEPGHEADPAVVQHMAETVLQLLDSLHANLLAKGKTYKNKALSALFLMNNMHYLVKAVESSPALAVIGEDWIQLHRDQVEQYGEEYQNQSWGPLIALVKDNRPPPSRVVNSAKDRGAIKELFLTLNGYIQGLQEQQSQWTIPDTLLRSNMKDAIAEDFLPLYNEFLEAYKGVEFTKSPEKYFKYSMKDIQAMLLETFAR